MAKQEPQVLLDMIVMAVRSNKRLDVEFFDHRGQRWVLSMDKEEKSS